MNESSLLPLSQIKNLENIAITLEEKSYSYKDLLNKINYFLIFLKDIPKGSILAIVGDFSLESIAIFLAGLKLKLILAPLMLDKELDLKLKSGEVDYLFKDSKLNKYDKQINIKNQLFNKLQNCAGLLIFSSGSTGTPKAILHNLDNYLKSYENKKQKNINLLAMLLFDHIGGLNTMFNSLAMGANLVIPKNRKNPKEIAYLIQKFKISLLPTSPTLLNLILISEVNKNYDLSSLKIITYGTETMSESLLNRLKKEFKNVKFKQSFGASEIGIAQTSGELLIKISNMEYKIINNELFIKSKTQSLGYLNASNSAFKKDGYFATGDLVEIIKKDDIEYLKIIGRAKEIINIGGQKTLPQEIESAILELPYIKDCLVYGEINQITGQSISAKIVSLNNLSNAELKKKIRMFLKTKLEPYKIPSKIIKVDSINMTNRMKKDRNIIKNFTPNTMGGGLRQHKKYYCNFYKITYLKAA